MPTLYDDFERANGAPGNGWANQNGAASISGGSLVGGGWYEAYQSGISDTSRNEATTHHFYGATYSQCTGPCVKMTGVAGNGFWLGFLTVAATPTVVIKDSCTYNGNGLASAVMGASPGPFVKLTLVYEEGHLSGYVNDVLLVEANSGLYGTGRYMGVSGYGSGGPIADFRCVGGAAVQLAVDPQVIGNYGSCVSIVLTGTGTNWTPGTPGSPLFTVNHGSITTQVVTDATHCTAVYCPGSYLGPVVFTDPSTAATATALVTSDVTVVPPTDTCPFTPQAVAMVNNTAGDSWLETLTKPSTPIHVTANAELELATILGTIGLNTGATVNPAEVGANGLLALVWALINGGGQPALGPWLNASGVPLSEQLGGLLVKWSTLITANEWTLGDVIVQLAGEGVKTHLDLYNAIQAIDGGTAPDLTAVLDAIAAARGLDAPSIRTAVDLLGELATIAGYTLGDVHGWIDAIPAADLSPVTAKLALIQPSTTYNLTTLAAQAASLTTAAVAIKAELDEVKALLEALEIPAGGGPVAPLWPGEASVSLGESHALAHGLQLSGPMHGILLTITGHPDHFTRYRFGAVDSWARVGQVVFCSDRGDYERSQSFSMDSQIMVPAVMESADLAAFRVNEGWTGTVRTWTKA